MKKGDEVTVVDSPYQKIDNGATGTVVSVSPSGKVVEVDVPGTGEDSWPFLAKEIV